MPSPLQKHVINIEPVYLEIGRRMRWLREQRGWTLSYLGGMIEVHSTTLAAWENALARVGIAELVRVAHGLGVPLAVFLADLPLEACQPHPEKAAQRKRTAQKRLANMKANGQTTGRKNQ